MGKVLNINPPVALHPPETGLQVPTDSTALCFPIYVGEGDKMELVLFIKS
jgi:hypothetical protein